MRVYILIGECKIDEYGDGRGPYTYTRTNVSVHQSKQDAQSEMFVRKHTNSWPYDDYDIEEFDV